MFEPKVESLDYHVNKIIEEHPEVKQLIEQNGQYQSLLEQKTKAMYSRYKHVLSAGLLVDKWDRFGAKIKIVLESIAGLLGLRPLAQVPIALLDTLEFFYKIPYALYYTAKTGNYGALPGWIANEVASTFLPFGSVLDLRNNYVNRAKKFLREKVAQDFTQYVRAKNLEQMLSQGAQPRPV